MTSAVPSDPGQGLGHTLLPIALRAASAGAQVLEAGAEDLGIESKDGTGNIVTAVDIAAERAVRRVLEQARPEDQITGEELGATVPASAPSGIRWSVDPLDGTANFACGLPHFATSVAAIDMRTGRWLLGVVSAPRLDTTYFALRGNGAYSRRPGQQARRIHAGTGHRPRLLGTGLSYDAALRTWQWARLGSLLADYDDIRCLGSAALGLCEAARGALAGFVESDLYEHDWAAGALIAEEAGLVVSRPSTFRGGISALSAPAVDHA
jgi:myo-inositol-1(or 4)-monophosphatase